MPELPEVHTFGNYIKRNCVGKKIKEINCIQAERMVKPSCAVLQKKLKNTKIKAINQKGKYLLISFSSIPETLIMHFGMSGSVHYANQKSSKEGDDRYTKVTFIFDNDYELRWIDKRKFGKILLVDSIDKVKSIASMGPDPLKISQAQFLDILDEHKSQKIKVFLMDQKNIGGIGNEYSDEILYHAGIRPDHQIKDLDKSKRIKLYKVMRQILKAAIKLKRPFGKFDPKKWLQEHRKKNAKCPKNHPLKITKFGGRTSYWCPVEQK